jgi:hypothetical protein
MWILVLFKVQILCSLSGCIKETIEATCTVQQWKLLSHCVSDMKGLGLNEWGLLILTVSLLFIPSLSFSSQPRPPPSLPPPLHLRLFGWHSTFPLIYIHERKVSSLSDLLLGFLQFLYVFEYLAEPSDAGSLYRPLFFQTHVPFTVSSAFYTAKV